MTAGMSTPKPSLALVLETNNIGGGADPQAVESLKPDFRTVFTVRDIEELSTEETAEALDISVSAVKSRLLRARLALREKLTRQFKRKGDDFFGHL